MKCAGTEFDFERTFEIDIFAFEISKGLDLEFCPCTFYLRLSYFMGRRCRDNDKFCLAISCYCYNSNLKTRVIVIVRSVITIS